MNDTLFIVADLYPLVSNSTQRRRSTTKIVIADYKQRRSESEYEWLGDFNATDTVLPMEFTHCWFFEGPRGVEPGGEGSDGRQICKGRPIWPTIGRPQKINNVLTTYKSRMFDTNHPMMKISSLTDFGRRFTNQNEIQWGKHQKSMIFWSHTTIITKGSLQKRSRIHHGLLMITRLWRQARIRMGLILWLLSNTKRSPSLTNSTFCYLRKDLTITRKD